MLIALDLGLANQVDLPAMTPTEVLISIDIKNPSNAQSKECAAILREHLGGSKRINGLNKWRIPFKKERWSPLTLTAKDDDRY